MQLIKVPTSLGGLSSQKGAELAPDRVVAKLKEIWLSEAGQIPVFNISEVRIVPSNIAETARAIQQAASAHKQFAMIGGDHFITNPSFKGFATNFRNAGIVVFDAHADLMPTIPGAITHEDWLRELITAGALKPENVIIVGLRNVDKEERAFIQKMRIKNFSMHEITTEGIHEICDAVMSAVQTFDGLYVSIDIDVVDPAFAPGTGYPEPGGFSSRDLIYFLQRLRLLKNFMALDVVEINPLKDVQDLTVKLGAKLLVESYKPSAHV